MSPNKNAPAGHGTGREDEAADVGSVGNHCAALATKANLSAATVPFLMTHQAKRGAVRILSNAWLEILAIRRGERVI